MNKVHVYQMRHVFVDDEHVGKYNLADRTIRFRPECEEHKDRCLAHFRMAHGIFCKALVGAEELAQVAPVREFPDEIRALMDLRYGDRTPAVLAWARENFTAEEFALRYPTLDPENLEEVHEAPVLAVVEDAAAVAGAVTADQLGGPIDGDDDDEVVELMTGKPSVEDADDDFRDEDPLRDVVPDPTVNDGVTVAPEEQPQAEGDPVSTEGFSLVGDDIQFNGKVVAALFGEDGEEKQLRMKQGQHGKKAGALAFLASLKA